MSRSIPSPLLYYCIQGMPDSRCRRFLRGLSRAWWGGASLVVGDREAFGSRRPFNRPQNKAEMRNAGRPKALENKWPLFGTDEILVGIMSVNMMAWGLPSFFLPLQKPLLPLGPNPLRQPSKYHATNTVIGISHNHSSHNLWLPVIHLPSQYSNKID